MNEQQQAVRPSIKPRDAAPKHEVLGTIDIGAGLPNGAWDAVGSGVPNAMFEAPGWERKTALDKATPKARPGYVQRWVRIAQADGKPDAANKSEALMTGWRPRRAETLAPEEHGMPVYDAGDGKGGVIVFKEQLLLCEMRTEQYQAACRALEMEHERINRVIYQQTMNNKDLPSRYASMGFEGGRDTAGLIDD